MTVTGAGLTWTRVNRANVRAGATEIWVAPAPAKLTNVTVRAVQTRTNFDLALTVVAFRGAAGVGASATANAATGAPTVTLTPQASGSFLFAAGNDWDNAIARVLPAGQTMVSQWLAPAGDTLWVQRQTATSVAGTPAALYATAPTTDRWNMAAVEIRATDVGPDITPPSIPGTLTATASATSIALAWGPSTDNVGVVGYDVHRSSLAGFTPGLANRVAQPTANAFADAALAPGAYYYRVIARDAAGLSGPPSNEAVATVLGPDNSPPGAPGTLTAIAGNGSAALAWGAATDDRGVAGYDVHRSSVTGFTPALANRVGQPTANAYADASLAPGTYYYRVIARDAAGNSGPPSNEATATILGPDTSPPGAPGTLTVVAGNGSAALAWGAATDDRGIAGYDVHRSTAQGFAPAATNRIGQPAGTTFSDTGLAAGTFYYRVIARDTAGNTGAPSNEGVGVVTGPADPRATTGEWGAVVNTGTLMQHAVLMPNSNKVLYFTSGGDARVVDLTSGLITSVPTQSSNLFCAGHAILSDGRAIVIGGDDAGQTAAGIRDTNIFDVTSMSWTRAADMAFARWYPTATTLPDGRVLAISGSNNGCLTCFVTKMEIYDPATNTWTPMASSSDQSIEYYPFTYVLPNGKLLLAGASENPTNTQTLDFTTQTWTVVDSRIIDGASAAMFVPGKVLKAGTASDGNYPATPSSSAAWVLDMTAANPSWTQVGSMANPRAFMNLTNLPDGTVLATGGWRTADGVIAANAVRAAEVWSPSTGQWTTLAAEARQRSYHSVAMLLPDGRVLSGGGGNDAAVPTEPNYQIFSPPYLFKGPRPAIGSAPSQVTWGQTFTVSTPDASRIASAVLMSPSSVTHAFDEHARSVPLTLTAGTNSVQLTAPLNANLAPPGYYMLFIVDTNGVPSVASWVKVQAVADGVAPGAPGTASAAGGVGTANIAWGPAIDNVAVTGYRVYRSTVSGFVPSTANQVAAPAGLTYTDSGLAAGTYYYLVAASDAAGNVGPSSNQVSAVVTAPPPPPPSSLSVDRTVAINLRGTAVTPTFSTAEANELLVAFVMSDGPGTAAQSATVSGAGLAWTLVRRTNTQSGTAEIWQAMAPAVLTNVTVTSTLGAAGFDQSLVVVAFKGAAGVGASNGASGTTGAQSVALTTTASGSLVYATGFDWDGAAARTVGSAQSLAHQSLVANIGTMWVQRFIDPIAGTGTIVTSNTTAPTNHRWNFSAVEIVAR
ncbi:MAG: galactose oxidase-like domain-containing protein [Dehalococcoidia bacterium]